MVIGSGAPEHLPEVRQATGYRGTLLSDGSRKSFEVLGLKRGLGGLIGLGPLRKGLAALRAGHRPGALQGDALQQGGAVIIRPDSTVIYIYRSSEAGEHPSVDTLLEAAGS